MPDVSNKIPKIEGLDNNLYLEKLWVAGNPIGAFEKKHFTPGYFFGNVPIKEFDQQLMSMKPVTNEERKQHGCM